MLTTALLQTLQIIDNRYKLTGNPCVYLPLDDYIWFDGVINNFKKLAKEGYIIRKKSYDSGLEVQLTEEGIKFLERCNRKDGLFDTFCARRDVSF